MQIRSACLWVALWLPMSSGAQSVRVGVVDRATRAPVAGAIASLVDSVGNRVTARLTDERGAVLLTGTTGRRVRIIIETIGYVTERTAVFELIPGTTERLIAIESRPLVLEKVAIRARGRCAGGPEGASAATVWEEVRKALTATTLTSEHVRSFAAWRYVRRLDLLHRVIAETTSTTGAQGTAFTAASASLLSAEGFTRDVAGTAHYFAPDAQLLLDPAFVQTHCFTVKDDDGSNRLVGLAFSPTPDRSEADIEGVLWISRESGALRLMEFTYSRQLPATGEHKAGGRVDFERLPNGAWVVQQWYIRLPVLARGRETRVGRLTTAQRDSVVGFREEGGWLSGSGSVGDSIAAAVLSGTVVDSLQAQPLANVRIALGGGAAESRTDSGGRYVIRHFMPGRYLVRAHHPRLAAFGGDTEREVVLSRGQTTTTDWAVPGASTVRVQHCPPEMSRLTAVLAHVVDSSSGQPIEGARLQARWRTITLRSVDGTAIAASTDSLAETTTDQHGLAALCIGVRGGRVSLRADHDGREVEHTVSVPDSVSVSETRLLLPARADARFRLQGRVVIAGSGTPVAAEVLLPSLGRTTHTAGDGSFELGGLPGGATALIIRSPGYNVYFARVVPPLGDSLRNFALEPLPQSLIPVIVTATRDIRGFEERRALESGGSYLSREDLAARETSRLSDILRTVRGIRILRRPDGARVVVSARGQLSRSVRDCPYQIILDGQRLFALRAGDSPPPSIDDFVPAHLEGIEIYSGPATTPPQFGGLGAACGTILLWTRRNLP